MKNTYVGLHKVNSYFALENKSGTNSSVVNYFTHREFSTVVVFGAVQ